MVIPILKRKTLIGKIEFFFVLVGLV